jgi:hypothetical protein
MKKLSILDYQYIRYYKEHFKHAQYIIMNKETYNQLMLEIDSNYPIEKLITGKLFYRGIEIIIKDEILTNKFLVI